MAASKKHPKNRPKPEAAERVPPSCNPKKLDTPDFPNILDSPSVTRLEAYKCKCRSSWCPKCFRARYAKIVEYLMAFDYRHTIMVTCTFDPRKCVTDEDSDEENKKIPYQFLIDKSTISAFIDALKNRKKKGMFLLKVLGYIAFLEFHKNGNPHYHVIIHFADDAYREHDLQKSWKYGSLDIREFSSRNEYLDFFPYLRKDPLRYPGESHQVMPPQDWLDEYPKINRILSSKNIRLGDDRRNRNRSQGDVRRPSDKSTKRPIVYHKGLKKCGKETRICIYPSKGKGSWCKLPIDYYEVTKLPGHYNAKNAYEFDDPDSALELLGSPKRLEKLKALGRSKKHRPKKK